MLVTICKKTTSQISIKRGEKLGLEPMEKSSVLDTDEENCQSPPKQLS